MLEISIRRAGQILVLLVLVCVPLSYAQAFSSELMLPQVYRGQEDVAGWLVSEKLDGVRGYWDGKRLLSKNGNLLHPPLEFICGLPPFALEGELWGGRGRFQQTLSIVKQQKPHADWLQLQFAIFDVPEAPGPFSERIEQAATWFNLNPSAYAFVIPQIPVRDQAHLQQQLTQVENLGGEGLIVRRPDAWYASGRSAEILKVKSYQDAEARVVGHLPGKGRNLGRLGSMLVEAENGLRFKIGSGFSDRLRDSPPALGSLITYKYYGRYSSGIPKFPVFLRVRKDSAL